MEVQTWKIGDVHPYKNNPRNNTAAVKPVANSIKEFGFQQPIVVDKDGVIIVGHTRYKAAKMLKLKEVPVELSATRYALPLTRSRHTAWPTIPPVR